MTVVATINKAKDTSGQCLSDAVDFTTVHSGFNDNVEAKLRTWEVVRIWFHLLLYSRGTLYFCVCSRRGDFLYAAI